MLPAPTPKWLSNPAETNLSHQELLDHMPLQEMQNPCQLPTEQALRLLLRNYIAISGGRAIGQLLLAPQPGFGRASRRLLWIGSALFPKSRRRGSWLPST